jgi:hypothetical protein
MRIIRRGRNTDGKKLSNAYVVNWEPIFGAFRQIQADSRALAKRKRNALQAVTTTQVVKSHQNQRWNLEISPPNLGIRTSEVNFGHEMVVLTADRSEEPKEVSNKEEVVKRTLTQTTVSLMASQPEVPVETTLAFYAAIQNFASRWMASPRQMRPPQLRQSWGGLAARAGG